jgi:hypothetical protein
MGLYKRNFEEKPIVWHILAAVLLQATRTAAMCLNSAFLPPYIIFITERQAKRVGRQIMAIVLTYRMSE